MGKKPECICHYYTPLRIPHSSYNCAFDLQKAELLTTFCNWSNRVLIPKRAFTTIIGLPKIDILFAFISKEQTSSSATWSTKVVSTTSNWTKSQSPKVLSQQYLASLNFDTTIWFITDFFIHLIYHLFGLSKASYQSQDSGYLAYLDDKLIFSKTEIGTFRNVEQYFWMLMQSWS